MRRAGKAQAFIATPGRRSIVSMFTAVLIFELNQQKETRRSAGAFTLDEIRMSESETTDILTLTTEIVASYVSNTTHLKIEEIPALIRSVRAALSEDAVPVAPAEPKTPKASKSQINKSIQSHGLTSFIDGKVYKTLKRHLARHGHDMTSYKAAYGLPSDYPSVASDYSAARSAMARNLGLGARRQTAKVATPTAKPRRKKTTTTGS